MELTKRLRNIEGAKEFSRELALIGELNSGSLMNSLPLKLLPDNSLAELIDAFAANNVDAIVIGDETKIEGIVSKRDLLNKLDSPKLADMEKKRIKEVLTKNYVNVSESGLLEDLCKIMIKNKPACLVVSDKKRFLGIIGYVELLAGFRKFCLQIDNPPSIGPLLKLHEVHMAGHLMTLDVLIKSMRQRDVDYALVMKENSPIGIISSKDVVNALRKDLSWDKMNANTIMSPHIVSLNSGNSINEALVIMLDRKFNQIPIIDNQKLTGILTLPIILEVFYNFINELKVKISRNKITDVVGVAEDEE